MAKYANRHRRLVEFTPEMLVWLKTDHLQLASNLSRKLSAKWAGPYPITEVVNPVAMRLQLPPDIRLHPVVHVSQLKVHEGDTVVPRQPVTVDDSGDEYEVEDIMGHRLSRGVTYF